jgi:SNF2 family DNA or RNA helicase
MNLRPNQIAHAEALPLLPEGILVDDPGAGKTATMLTAIRKLLSDNDYRWKALVVAPKFVSLTVWEQEAHKWTPDLVVRVLGRFNSQERGELLQDTSVDLYIINYEIVRWLTQYLKHHQGTDFEIVVLDEITRVKNSQGKTNKRLQLITERAEHVWGLTGTPIGKNLLDVFGQAVVLGIGDVLARNITAYKRKYFFSTDLYGFKWQEQDGAKEEIYKALKPFMLRSETQAYESRNYTEIDVALPMPEEAWVAYKDVRDELYTELGGAELVIANAAVATGKLTQVTGGNVYVKIDDGDPVPIYVHDFKLRACIELIESLQGKPCILSYHYRHELERIKETLERKEIVYATLDTPNAVELFNEGEFEVLLVHPASAAHGLNLQEGGHHMIIYSMASFWSQEVWRQFIGRMARPGQKHTVRVYKLLCERTIDTVIDKVCHGRIEANDNLLEAMK